MLPDIEFYFDVVSPYSYIAAKRIHELNGKANIIWRPFLLGGVMKAVGSSAPITIPSKGRYMFQDLQQLSEYYQIPLTLPEKFPVNTITAMRALSMLPQKEMVDKAQALFNAYWGEGKDISDEKALLPLLGEPLIAQANTDEAKSRLRDTTEQAVARGAFGAPSFFLNEKIYFGEDRLFLLKADLDKLS